MIPLKDQNAIKQRFARDLSGRLRVDFFGRKPSTVYIPGRRDCVHCEEVRTLLRELSGLSPRISLTQHDIEDDAEAAQQLGVDKVPATVLRGQANRPLRFFGSPFQRQFAALIEMFVLVAGATPQVTQEVSKPLRRIRSDVSLKVLVATGCTHSPAAVLGALRLALQSPRIHLEVIEVSEFPELVQRFWVKATPLTVLQDRFAVPGVMDEAVLAQNLLLAAQGNQPNTGGDPKRLTPYPPRQPRQQQQRRPRPSSSGLILPR